MTRLRIVAAATVVTALLTLAGGARAATVTSLPPFTENITDSVSDDCRGGLAGTLTGTVTTTMQFVDTYPPTQGFYLRGTSVAVYRIDFSDNSYALGSFTVHFASNGPVTPQGVGLFTSSTTTLDKATVYDGTGQALGTEIIHVADHTTAQFFPDNTFVVHVSFDMAHLTCSI